MASKEHALLEFLPLNFCSMRRRDGRQHLGSQFGRCEDVPRAVGQFPAQRPRWYDYGSYDYGKTIGNVEKPLENHGKMAV